VSLSIATPVYPRRSSIFLPTGEATITSSAPSLPTASATTEISVSNSITRLVTGPHRFRRISPSISNVAKSKIHCRSLRLFPFPTTTTLRRLSSSVQNPNLLMSLSPSSGLHPTTTRSFTLALTISPLQLNPHGAYLRGVHDCTFAVPTPVNTLRTPRLARRPHRLQPSRLGSQ